MQNDWNPETCARFRGLRLRPAIDLLAQVRDMLVDMPGICPVGIGGCV